MPLVQMAVNNAVGEVGIHFITFAIFAFAFSSLIGNYFYAETQLPLHLQERLQVRACSSSVCAVPGRHLLRLREQLRLWRGTWPTSSWASWPSSTLSPSCCSGKWALAALDDYTRQRNEGKDPVFVARQRARACPPASAGPPRICRTSATIRWRSTSRKPHRSTRRA